MNLTTATFLKITLTIIFVMGLISTVDARNFRGGSSGSINRSQNINRNVNHNVNRNVNVNHNVNINSNNHHGGCCYNNHHPVATVAAVAVTAAIIGSIVYSVPPTCTTVMVNGFAYQQCGSTWYQPRIAGTSTSYVVVNSPY